MEMLELYLHILDVGNKLFVVVHKLSLVCCSCKSRFHLSTVAYKDCGLKKYGNCKQVCSCF